MDTYRSNDDGDHFDALDFGDEAGYDGGVQWAIDALPDDTGDTEDSGAHDDEPSWELTTVTNPLETVSVTALMDGRIQNVELSAAAASMTESELADEVLVIADLASRRASSILHTLLLDGAKAQGLDGDGTFAELLGNRFLDLTSPERAAQAQAQVFATRYASEDAR